MPRYKTYPLLYDHVRTISIQLLRKNGLLGKEALGWGVIEWKSTHKVNKVHLKVELNEDVGCMELLYLHNNTEVYYFVEMVGVPSNLGKGLVWYFVCPKTGKQCRKLYWYNARFYHRTAIRGGMYEKQTRSKRITQLDNLLNGDCKNMKKNRLLKKYAKTHYAAKPTKWYLRMIKQIQAVKDAPLDQIKNVMMGKATKKMSL